MKNLDRGKNSVPPQVGTAYQQGKLRQDLESAQRENFRLQDEKEELSEKLEQEQTEKLSFQQRLEQAMQDLEVSQDERSQAIEVRDKALASRKSIIGRVGGLTASNKRLREKVEFLVMKNGSLQNLNKIAVEQVVAANQKREAFQEAYEKIKAAYQKLKAAYQKLRTDQQQNQIEAEQLQAKFERLKVACRRLKAEYEVLQATYTQDMERIATAYGRMSWAEQKRLPPELKVLLDQIAENQ